MYLAASLVPAVLLLLSAPRVSSDNVFQSPIKLTCPTNYTLYGCPIPEEGFYICQMHLNQTKSYICCDVTKQPYPAFVEQITLNCDKPGCADADVASCSTTAPQMLNCTRPCGDTNYCI